MKSAPFQYSLEWNFLIRMKIKAGRGNLASSILAFYRMKDFPCKLKIVSSWEVLHILT